jgi:serine/threonine protein kinase
MSSPIDRKKLIQAFAAFTNGQMDETSFYELLDLWADSHPKHRIQEDQFSVQASFSARAKQPKETGCFVVDSVTSKSKIKHSVFEGGDSFQLFSVVDQSRSENLISVDLSELPSVELREVSEMDFDTDAGFFVCEETQGDAGTSAMQFDAVSIDQTAEQQTKNNFKDQTSREIRRDDARAGRDSGIDRGRHRFDFIRPHAEGGLGVVSVARDTELNREVAFKEIKPKYFGNQTLRTRFNIEALITGSLEHPGVVPVYGYGNNDDGSPWLAMRFIKGKTLKDAINGWHKSYSSPFESSESRLAFRNLLSRFVDACFAIAYANSRGVLHRDIKPSNIMLGKFGETLVVDWGLAKKVGRANPADSSCGDASVIIDSRDTASTMDGSALGTPPYMSPEQAAGRLDAMGPGSDIFSLGATLYVLLVGRTAFDGTTVQEVIENARSCNYQPPVEHKSTIPKPLNSICCHAMAAVPGDRYSSALDLARDIESWLADEPVTAHIEKPVERLFRWVRRHKVFATSACFFAVAISLLSTIGILLVNAEKNRTLAAMSQVQLEKNRTDQALVQLEESQEETVAALIAETTARRQTGDLLNTITDDFVGELLSRRVELGDEDRLFFDRVLQQFSEFTKTAGNSGEAMHVRADGHFRIANLRRRLDDFEPAEQSYLAAEQIYEELASRDPQPPFREDIAAVNANLAILYAAQGKHAKAIKRENKSIEILETLVDGYPDTARYQIELARVHLNRGNAHARTGSLDKAEHDFRISTDIFEKMASLSTSTTVHRQYANGLTSLASFYSSNKKKLRTAADTYQQAIDVLLANKEAGKPAHETQLALARQNYGNLLLRLKRNDDAVDQFRLATDSCSLLANKYPSVFSYSRDWGRSMLGLSRAMDQKKRGSGKSKLVEANRIIETLTKRYPERIDIQKDNALVVEQMARMASQEKDLVAATLYLQQAVDLRTRISNLRPGNELLVHQAFGAKINLASHFRKNAQYKKAIASYTTLLEALVEEKNSDSRFLRLVRFGMGDCFMKQRQYPKALPFWTLLSKSESDPAWSTFELQRAICLIYGGNVTDGIAAADSVHDSGNPVGVKSYDVACCYAIAAGVGNNGEVKEHFAQRAIELLQEAEEGGFFHSRMIAHSKTDPDLDNVRSHPMFVKFMSSLEGDE